MKPNASKKRLKYEKPAMQVYELKGRARLLAGSGNGINPMGDPEDI